MKLRWTIIAGVLALTVSAVILIAHLSNKEKNALQATQSVLHQQGFKIALAEFDFSAQPELTARAAAITNASSPRRNPGTQQLNPELMTKVGSDSALIVWQQDDLTAGYRREELWPALSTSLDGERATLDTACAAVLSGPYRVSLNANAGSGMLLPHLASIRFLQQTLAARAFVELRASHRAAAWTNLLAATRLLTAWDAEPIEIPQLVRLMCANIAYDAAWQVLQAGGWSDDQLAALQHEWESVDFLTRLPKTVAFTRASTANLCQREREQPLTSAPPLAQIFHDPRSGWANFTYYWQQLGYRKHGSYADENGILLFYRNQELEYRRAVQAPTWAEMRSLPAVTNFPVYQSKSRTGGRWQSMLNMRQMSVTMNANGVGLLARASEAETRRRLAVTAIALERYHNRHGYYPAMLTNLAPEFTPPLDFMDGQPLRYRLAAGNTFVLYSVGLDCADNGGKLAESDQRRLRAPIRGNGGRPGFGMTIGEDLVWPRPASPAEIAAQKAAEQTQADRRQAAMEERERVDREEAERERKQTVDRLLAEAATGKTTSPSSATNSPEPIYQGKPLAEVLQNKTATGTNQLTLLETLAIKQIITGDEPDTITFELPVSYDTAPSFGRLHLLVDGGLDSAPRFEESERQTCKRATNGNCLLNWDTTYDPPGLHALQAEFIATKNPENEDDEHTLKVQGLAAPYLSTNLCQFDPAYSSFDETGANLYARLTESNGTYTINIKTPTGELVRILKGRTTNGIIKVHWDLKDDQGRRYTNASFNTTFDITLPDSGKTQHMK